MQLVRIVGIDVKHSLGVAELSLWSTGWRQAAKEYGEVKKIVACLPVLLYGTEACPLKKSHIASLQFVVNSSFAKISNIRSKIVIEECQFYFNFSAVSDQIAKLAQKFMVNTKTPAIYYVQLFALHVNNYLLVKLS